MRHHNSEVEVRKIIDMPPNSEQRRHALCLLRNDTNFDLYIKGTIRPKRSKKDRTDDSAPYYPCAYCKGLFLKNYLKRHSRSCPLQRVRSNDNKICFKNNKGPESSLTNAKVSEKKTFTELLPSDKIVFESNDGPESSLTIKKVNERKAYTELVPPTILNKDVEECANSESSSSSIVSDGFGFDVNENNFHFKNTSLEDMEVSNNEHLFVNITPGCW